MCTSNLPVLVRNCLNPRNLKPEEGSGALQTHMCPVSPNRNIPVRVVGLESKMGILIHIHYSDTENVTPSKSLHRRERKMKCDVLVQVSLFKKEKLKKHFWQLKCYVGLQPFLEYVRMSQSILFLIKLNHRQPSEKRSRPWSLDQVMKFAMEKRHIHLMLVSGGNIDRNC